MNQPQYKAFIKGTNVEVFNVTRCRNFLKTPVELHRIYPSSKFPLSEEVTGEVDAEFVANWDSERGLVRGIFDIDSIVIRAVED